MCVCARECGRGAYSSQPWFQQLRGLQQDFPFISSSLEGRQPPEALPQQRLQDAITAWDILLNEDRWALPSHCAITKSSVVFVCWSALELAHLLLAPSPPSPPSPFSILPSSENGLTQQCNAHTQSPRRQFVWTIYRKTIAVTGSTVSLQVIFCQSLNFRRILPLHS